MQRGGCCIRVAAATKHAKDVGDDCGVGDSSAYIVEGVRQLLEAVGLLGDRHITLVEAVEFVLGVHGTLEAVVEEEAEDLRPGGVGREMWLVNGVHDILGHGGVQPGDDAGVDLCPFDVVAHEDSIDGAVDVVGEAEFLERELEEGAPLAKVGGLHLERDRDVRLDVDHGDRRSRGWIRERSSKGVGVGGGGTGGRRVRHEHEKRAAEGGAQIVLSLDTM